MAGKSYLKSALTILLLMVVLAFAGTAHAKTIFVDDDAPVDFDNIQAAIDAAVDGDIIVVSPGTYTGDGNRDIDYNGKAITVRSIDPNDPNIVTATIIDCNGTEQEPHRGFYFHNGEEANSIIAGLTITNGYASAGAAIRCGDSGPKITNCTFTGNTSLYGAGIHCGFPPGGGAQSSPEILYDFNIPGTKVTNCTFTGNSGHGMRIDGSSAVLRNCIFTENSDKGLAMVEGNLAVVDCTFTANQRGGMLISLCNAIMVGSVFKDNSGTGAFILEGNATFIYCEFTDNRAYSQAGGLYNGDSETTLKNCIFTGNFGNNRAGGIHNELKSNLTMVDCTISGNSADVGGGLYNDNKSSAKLTNCIFSDNSANQGAGIYTRWVSLELTDCKFNNNSADPHEGGGIYCDLSPVPQPTSSPGAVGLQLSTEVLSGDNLNGNTFTNCTFTGNSAASGGGIYNISKNLTIVNCIFSENSADRGGGMYNTDANPTLTNCTFAGNSAKRAGGMCNDESSPTLTNCTFSENSALLAGGMFNCSQSNPTLTNCTFIRNSANQGGGMENDDSTPTLTNCSFRGNRGFSTCAGMVNLSSTAILTNCIFGGNSASKYAGMFNSNSNLTMINCSFIGNAAERHSGGMYNLGSTLILSQCIFSGNISSGPCGAILTRGSYHRQSHITLTNCTFVGNLGTDGNSLVFDSHSSCPPSIIQLTNSIIWDGENPIWNNDGSTISINYSDVQGGWPGTGNIDTDPFFVSPGYWDTDELWVDGDYQLLPGSPCIDTGDPNYVTEPNETDLDGRPRVMGGRIDMGAYESPIFAEARILPKTINLASKGNWITCYIWLPDEYNVADIEPNSIFLEDEIRPEQFTIDEQQQVATARFSREVVQPILEVGDINLKITGRLTNGTVFEATDTIKVINKAGKN